MIWTLVLLFFSGLFQQGRTIPVTRWMIEVDPRQPDCLLHWHDEMTAERGQLLLKKLPVGDWWVMELPADKVEELDQLPCASRWIADQKITWRVTPDDPAYVNQSGLNLIGMPAAWDISTGGVTANGDTIVVAVIDDGFELTHVDLAGNLWINYGEIANDGMDNDGNGYIDDRVGYNVNSMNDDHPIDDHGTEVCGVIGARGNNKTGISGVNWQVKLMPVSGANFESQLIEAYQYVTDMRKLYRESGGAKGAFIVASNLSGGVNNEWAADHPLWCEMYDKQGEEGVLSVCAAPNSAISVDMDGDMPTTCASSFMIAVTNVDLTDALVGNAGYGPVSIDIGAPGQGTISTSLANSYENFPGTSAATPHVAGAIALVYSTPCENFLAGLDSNPKNVAERVRDIILETGKANNDLMDITTTGKRLQVSAAMEATVNSCGSYTGDAIVIEAIWPNPVVIDHTRLFFRAPGPQEDLRLEIYTTSGARVGLVVPTADEVEQGYIDIDTRSFPAGMYLVTLWRGKEKSTRKLIVF